MEKITDLINIFVAEKGNEYTVSEVKKAFWAALASAALILFATAI